jgi:hypothetical protein
MRKVIPQEVHMYCDRCGARCLSGINFKRQATAQIHRGEPDHMLEYCSHTKTFDLCDDCSDEVLEYIQGNIE